MDAKDVVVGELYFISSGDQKGEVLYIDEGSGVVLVRESNGFVGTAMIRDLEVEKDKIFSVRANVTHTDSRWMYGAKDKEEAIEKYVEGFRGIHGEDATYGIIEVKEVDDSRWNNEGEDD